MGLCLLSLVEEGWCGNLTRACLRHCACVFLDCIYKCMFCIISGSLMFVARCRPYVGSRCRGSQSSRQCRLECSVSCCMLGPRPHSLVTFRAST